MIYVIALFAIAWPLYTIAYHLGKLVAAVHEIVLMYQLQGAAGEERKAEIEAAIEARRRGKMSS